MIGDFILVTAFWNEAHMMHEFISSIMKQKVKPKCWLLIDDGSNDGSATVAKKACDEYQIPYLLYSMPEKNQGNFETIGHAFTAAFNHFREDINRLEIEFLVKLDVDTRLPSEYLAIMDSILKKYPQVGVISGQIRGEGLREKGPMGTGKAVRWSIASRIQRYWRGDPDTLWNVKAGEYRYWILTIDDLLVETTRPSQGFTKSGARLLGRQYSYSRRHPIIVVYIGIKMIIEKKYGFSFLAAYLRERLTGLEEYNDDYIMYYNSLKFHLIRAIYRMKFLKRVSIHEVR